MMQLSVTGIAVDLSCDEKKLTDDSDNAFLLKIQEPIMQEDRIPWLRDVEIGKKHTLALTSLAGKFSSRILDSVPK